MRFLEEAQEESLVSLISSEPYSRLAKEQAIGFATPSQLIAKHKAVDKIASITLSVSQEKKEHQ